MIRITRDIGLFHNRQSRLSARRQRAESTPIALLRCPRCHRRAHESRGSRPNSARFGNAPTVRNPTHRAVTNATFTSGCVHDHRAWFRRLCSLVVSTRCSSAHLATSLHVPVRRPSPALRSSVSSEGSLLFVVCPSRISTHSVSGETHYRSLLPNPRPLCPSFLPSCCSFVASVVVASPHARRLSRTRAIKRRRLLGCPLERIKMATAFLARSRSSLHHPAQSRPGIPRRGISLISCPPSPVRRPLCRCNQGFRR